MMMVQSLFQSAAYNQQMELQCHDNVHQTKRFYGIDDNQISKFKFHSKTFYLKLKHFYEAVEDFEDKLTIELQIRERYANSTV